MSSAPADSRPAQKKKSKTVLAAVLIVLVSLSAGAGLYYLFSGSTGDSGAATPKCSISLMASEEIGFVISNMTEYLNGTVVVPWSDIQIRLWNMSTTTPYWGMYWRWDPPDMALRDSNGQATTETYAGEGVWSPSSASITCNVTDLEGNGKLDNGDFFTIAFSGTVLSPNCMYEVMFIYDDTSEPMGTCQFSGPSK